MVTERKGDHFTQIVERPGRTTLRVRRARLKVIVGPDEGLEKELQHEHVVVGSAPGCDFVLSDSAVSRRHFELLPQDDGYLLRDLDSRNGTFVKGLDVIQARLSGGEEIDAGRSVLRISVLDEHEELPLSHKNSFGSMVGRSATMRLLFAMLERVAPSDATVLLEGESGTGKDLAAENLHLNSRREGKPFVVVDCGAVAPSLVESELFGHRKGAFTGAERDRPGVFESAQGGTVFLDEVGEIDLPVQPKLLRLLDKREVRRLGENRYRPVNVRLIVATNKDLAYEVQQSRFREDLFYRLSVVRVRLPALRERREDIGLLAREFIQKRDPDANPEKILTDQVLAMFQNHDWPGNVRELRNVVERLLLFPDLPRSAIGNGKPKPSSSAIPENFLDMTFREFQSRVQEHYEKSYLAAVLDACNGVASWAAKKSGLPRQTFYRLLNKYKLKK